MDATRRDALLDALRERLPKKQVLADAPMNRYTTLRLGGPAEALCEVASVEQLAAALQTARAQGVPVTILGNGSNTLVRDGGLKGLVVHIGESFGDVCEPVPLPDGSYALTAQAGATLVKLCGAAADHALSGLEFFSGIPGTVGGAVYMNAGAYGGEMKDVVTQVHALGVGGEPLSFTGEEMRFGYRHSVLCDQPEPVAVTSVTVRLTPSDEDTVRATMREFAARRREKQPLGVPSCGSTFKRPEGAFAGTLIEQAGLKGLRVGGASVSEVHAGFLVNDGEGTAADYLALIAHVQRAVYERTGVRLEPEVRILGEDAPVIGA